MFKPYAMQTGDFYSSDVHAVVANAKVLRSDPITTHLILASQQVADLLAKRVRLMRSTIRGV